MSRQFFQRVAPHSLTAYLGRVRLGPARLGLFLRGDRVVAALVQGQRVDAFVVDAEQPAAALAAELSQRKLAPRTVAIGLARAAVTVKPIELPSVEGELREMVRFELERHLPYGGDDTPFDCQPLPSDPPPTSGEVPSRPVLIVAADRRVVDGALRLAEDAKLRPVSITVAAHNLPTLVRRQRGGRIVWVHRADSSVDLLFLSGSQLVLSRSVVADDTSIADEIRRSFGVARWRDCEAIWVSGDAAPATAAGLAGLGAPVTEPPFSAAARALLDDLPDEGHGELMLTLAVAAGSRVRPLELLPPALRPRRLSREQLISLGTVAAAAVVGIAVLLAPGYRARRELAQVDAGIARLAPEVRAVEQVMQDLERQRRLLTTIQSIESSSVRPLPVLRELTELLPNDAWLTMLALDTKGVELTGQAQAAAALIPLLENSPRLERAEFSSPVTRGRDREQFRIRAAWEGGAPGAVIPAAARPPAGARLPTPGRQSTPPPAAAPVVTPTETPDEPDAEAPPMQPHRPLGPAPGMEGR